MFRKIITYICIIALGGVFGSCVTDRFDGPECGQGLVTLTLSNAASGSSTRANDDNYNENLISDVVVALYTDGPDETAPAVVVRRFDGLNAKKTTVVNFDIDEESVKTLFNNKANGAECRMFVVANVGDASIADNVTIEDLKKLAVGSAFDSQKEQDSFVMAGSGKITYSISGATESAAGNATLRRAAAKMSLNISLPASVTDDDGNIWVPVNQNNGIKVLLNNGVKSSVAVPGDKDNWTPADGDYYSMVSSDETVRTMGERNIVEGYPYSLDVPFYSYPNYWTESVEEKHKTTMTLMVPWQRQDRDEYRTFYYQVPVTDQTMLVQNYSYTVNLSVNMLGSLTPDTPEELTDLSYKIVDWNQQDINVDLNDYRFLVVSPREYTVNNRDQVSISFYSSHDVEIADITMEYKRFNFYSGTQGQVVNIPITKAQIEKSISGTESLCSDEVTNTGTNYTLTVKHPLKIWKPVTNRGADVQMSGNEAGTYETRLGQIDHYVPTEDNAYSPYTITVTLQHKDNPNFKETVVITQYPGMYIEADHNPGGEYATGIRRNTLTYSSYGYVFINAYEQTSRNLTYWTNDAGNLGGVHGLTGGNKNPNMYIIYTSVLSESESTDYIIGDPRIHTYANNLDNTGDITSGDGNPATSTANGGWCRPARALYEGSSYRTLTYYMPTREDNNTDKMVAPVIRVASSYGVTNHIGRTAARRRIATYQEQGCPAGRWRLPTRAELAYIVSLSSKGIIPELFSVGSEYWTAQGPYHVNNTNEGDGLGTISVHSGNAAVRGIYDEWYWSKLTDYQLQKNSEGGYDYTLGDMPYQGN